MRIAVIIPFRGNMDLLRWTLQGYAEQQLGPAHTLEIHVGLDGQDLAISQLPAGAFVRRFPRIGAAAVRNQLATGLSADILIFGNADARPDPDMVRIHAETLAALPTGSMVLGAAPWERPPAPTVFDALLADTPMVFFFNQLAPKQWYDFRHAWTLNLSVRHADFVAAGGFEPRLRPVYYEDLAFGHAVMGATRKGIFYEPAARVVHRHPTTLAQYLNREELLGLMSPVLATVRPEVFASLHGGRSVEALAAEYRAWVAMDGASHRWTYQRLLEWAMLPESLLASMPAAEAERIKLTIYQMHIPLKRLAFRLGFLKGLELADDARWQERQPVGLWQQAIANK